jgi:hypothetical protein
MLITNYIEQSPSWETNSRSAGQTFPVFYGTRSIAMLKSARHWGFPVKILYEFLTSTKHATYLPYLSLILLNLNTKTILLH